jgi:hypothetical protein
MVDALYHQIMIKSRTLIDDKMREVQVLQLLVG